MSDTQKHNKPNVPNLRFPEFDGEWEKKRLQECVSFLDEQRRPIKSNDRVSELGLYPYYGASGEIDRIDDYLFDDDLVLLSEDGANIIERKYRVAFIIHGKTWVNNHAHVLKPNKNIDINFLSESLERLDYAQYNTGTTMPKLNQEICRNIKLSIPSFEEQTKIGRFISLINERIELQSKVIEDLIKVKTAINDEFHKSNTHGVKTCFADLGVSYSGLSGKSAVDFGQGCQFIPYTNVFSNTFINEDDMGFVKIAEGEHQNKVEHGDLIITLSSETPEEVGVGSVYLGHKKDLYLNSFCFGIHLLKRDIVMPEYLAYLVESKVFRKFVYPLAQGSTRYNLQKGDFEKKEIIIPQIEKQQELITVLNAISNKQKLELEIMERLTMAKRSLLQRLFVNPVKYYYIPN